MCRLACAALCRKGVGSALMSHQRGVHQQRAVVAGSVGKREHQRIGEAESTHAACTVEGTVAVTEVLVGDEQCTLLLAKVFDDKLVASIVKLVYDGVAVAGVEGADAMPPFPGHNGAGVVDGHRKQKRHVGRHRVGRQQKRIQRRHQRQVIGLTVDKVQAYRKVGDAEVVFHGCRWAEVRL